MSDCGRLLAKPMRLWEYVGVQQAQEMAEAILITVMRSCRQKEHMVRLSCKAFGQLVPPCLLSLGRAVGALARVRGAFVRFVNDEEIPSLLPHSLPHFFLFGIV